MGLIRRLTCDHPYNHEFVRVWRFRFWIGVMYQCLDCGAEIAWYAHPVTQG